MALSFRASSYPTVGAFVVPGHGDCPVRALPRGLPAGHRRESICGVLKRLALGPEWTLGSESAMGRGGH